MNLKWLIIFAFGFPFLNTFSLAKNIEMSDQADKAANLNLELRLAQSNLLSFISCQRFADRENRQEQELKQCMTQFLHPSAGKSLILQYEHFLMLKHVISKPYACPTKTLQNLRDLNVDFDLALCFDSIRKPDTKQAIALFKNDKASLPKLIQLKF